LGGQAVEPPLRRECRCGQGADGLPLADAPLEVFEKNVVGALDIDAEAVDELFRRDDPPGLSDADAVGKVGRAGGPVHHHRHLAGQMQAEEDKVGGHARRQHHAHMLFRIGGKPVTHDACCHEQAAVGESPRHAVGGGYLLGPLDGPADKARVPRRGEPACGNRQRPGGVFPRRQAAIGEGPELAERVGDRA
jgi:hypothetical protein